MRVLVACEYSGIVRDAFTAAGHEAMSCDLLPTESPGPHYQGNALDVLHDGWDLMVCHPPCQYLSHAGTRHWHAPGRAEKRNLAVEFAMELYNAPIQYVAMENPKGHLGRAFRPPDQYINPFQFGEPVRKRIGLWLKGLPLLESTENLLPPPPVLTQHRKISGKVKARHFVETATDWKTRSKFFPGIAAAMAAQWGDPERLARLGRQQQLFAA
ncbi:DNA cytosine methyltransferase [Hymenobacter mucosus]|uniref:DNA (Cytosine-5)-methyltransferase 1 n=1 Tax=Hymenobacter mucosus TaxID=1411120 RepID=A0A239A7T4_9BACT|nr:DNA cytosine methyltransferase [Hymenobacter mucosus]SNR91695.1 hypothetical protein SAMN06269173_11147 [Hymenobacter mucosus]